MTPEELSYVQKHKLRRLTFDGFNDLYLHLRYGSMTVKDCMEKDARLPPKVKLTPKPEVKISEEMSIRNERCIDSFGCGLF